MTLPTDILFPLPNNYNNSEDVDPYLNDLVFSLQNMYGQLAQHTNGVFRNYADVDSSQWIPTVAGTSSVGAFTYDQQFGWVLRQGIMVDVFFNISWSASTGTGNLYVELPYLVTKSSGTPFNGVLQTSAINYGIGNTVAVVSGIPGTYRGELLGTGSTSDTSNITVPSAGKIMGHLRYIGTSDE